MKINLGQYQYWRADRITTAHTMLFRQHETNIWASWKEANPDEYQGLVRVGLELYAESVEAEFSRLMSQADAEPDAAKAVTLREEAFAQRNESPDGDYQARVIWRNGYEDVVDDSLVDAILDTVLTPLGHSIKPSEARKEAALKEVAEVTSFFLASIVINYSPPSTSPANGESSGDTPTLPLTPTGESQSVSPTTPQQGGLIDSNSTASAAEIPTPSTDSSQ